MRKVIVRGGGDLASGVIYRLHSCGFQTIVLEAEKPTHIRRSVSFAQAVFDGEIVIEKTRGVLADDLDDAEKILKHGDIPVLVDPEGLSIFKGKPEIVVDVIMAKKNLGTRKDSAPVVIAVGPGFKAGIDADAVVETCRGHFLGRVIWEGEAREDTGIPGSVLGYTSERVLRAVDSGVFKPVKQIGELVQKGDIAATVNGQSVLARISGIVRGMMNDGLKVIAGDKVGDIDPRGDISYCSYISDKALAVGGGVLEAVLRLSHC